MPSLEHSHNGQLAILITFFVLFFVSGLINKPRMKQLEYYHFYLIGALAIVANLLMLWFMNQQPGVHHDLLSLLLLQKYSIGSSFIVIGYCLIARGFGQFLRVQFAPSATYSKHIKF